MRELPYFCQPVHMFIFIIRNDNRSDGAHNFASFIYGGG